MDHDQVTKDRAKARVLNLAKEFFDKSIPERNRDIFWVTCGSKFGEMYETVKTLRRKLDAPQDLSVQEYALTAETYLTKFRDLTRKAGIAMLGLTRPT